MLKAKTDLGSQMYAQEISEFMSPVRSWALSAILNTFNDRSFVSAIHSKVEVTYNNFVMLKTNTQPEPAMRIARTKSLQAKI